MVIAVSSRGRFIAAAAAVLCYAVLPAPASAVLPPPAAASAVHAIAAAAGEILGELQQRFMSRLPAGGVRLSLGL